MDRLHQIFVVVILFFVSTEAFAQHDTSATNDTFFDITLYEPMRNRAIEALHKKDLSKAKSILDSCYALNNLDTMVIALLQETLLMHINKQKQPLKNLRDIQNWEKQYPFLRENAKLQKIKVQDAVSLGIEAFERKYLNSAEEFCKIIYKTHKEANGTSLLNQTPNVDALFYNVGLLFFYTNKFKQAQVIFNYGNNIYPKDKNMETMLKLSKERLKK